MQARAFVPVRKDDKFYATPAAQNQLELRRHGAAPPEWSPSRLYRVPASGASMLIYAWDGEADA